MSTWNLIELRESVERIHGTEQLGLLRPSLDSVGQRHYFASFHFRRAIAARSEAMKSPARADKHPFELLDDSELDVIHEDVRADFVACAQSMHAIPDTLAHVVYFALNFGAQPHLRMSDRNITAESVLSRLAEGSIKQKLEELSTHKDAQYLAALVNRAKHRQVVPIPYRYDLTDSATEDGFWFEAFTHKQKSYEARPVEQFLKSEFRRQSELIVGLGNALNAELVVRLADLTIVRDEPAPLKT